MSHNHSHNYNSSNIKLAFFLNLGFTIIEIIGGLMINSVAILSDALHDLGDSISLGLAWFLQGFSQKEENELYSYGYRRYSLLAALINTTVLIIGSFLIFYRAVPRLINPEATSATGMIGFAIFGVIVNGIGAYKTSGGTSLNEKVVSWHLFEDVLGWAAVLVVGIIMYFKEIYILDPLLSIGITLYILYNVFKNFKKTILLFLQAVPEQIDIQSIISKFKRIENVIDIHHTHVWSLDNEHHVLSTHLVAKEGISVEEIKKIKKEARELVGDMNIEHITLEVEFIDEECGMEN
ncbi:MAG: cation diffusion facilitator family transporter [Halanaerobiales bacterium]